MIPLGFEVLDGASRCCFFLRPSSVISIALAPVSAALSSESRRGAVMFKCSIFLTVDPCATAAARLDLGVRGMVAVAIAVQVSV
jgi:hypothetical protein